MGIIYMDFYYNRRDDMILSMSPLILLLFITQYLVFIEEEKDISIEAEMVRFGASV